MPASPAKPNASRLISPTTRAVIEFCRREAVDLVVVGPETPLAAGIVDDLAARRHQGVRAEQAAARLEGSKGFTKALCTEFDIPTGAYGRFAEAADGAGLCPRRAGAPIVVKADGLAAGKGVVVAMTLAEAEAAIAMMFDGALRCGGRRSRDRGISRRRRDQLLCAVRRRDARCRSRRRRTTSGCSTATRARTPAAWAPIRRRRS